jgi:DNA replication protein DnaC
VKVVIDETELRKTEETEVCKDCFGTGTKVDPVKGAVACPCLRVNRARRLMTAARIPRRYEKCSFSNFISEPGTSLENALLQAHKLAREYPAVDRGLIFMGPAGIGKTHLAVSIIRDLTEKGFASVFCEFGSLLKEIQDSYNPVSKSSELKVLAPVFQADVLVLDELGATVPTDWVRDTMYQIINRRYNDNKLTIFTTNYLDKPRSEKEQILEDRIGTRLRSRLYEMCKIVVMDGEDYRKQLGIDLRRR